MYVDISPRLGSLMIFCTGLAFSAASVAAEEVLMHGKLRWTSTDNGQDINFEDATAFCAMRGAGWRLPHVAELTAFQEAGASRPMFKLSGNWFWTNTPVTKEDSAQSDKLGWGVVLSNGRRTLTFKFMSFGSRALCVHAL